MTASRAPAGSSDGVLLALVLARRAPRRAARVLVVVTALVLVLAAVNPVLSADHPLTVVALEVEHPVVAGAFSPSSCPPCAVRPRPAGPGAVGR